MSNNLKKSKGSNLSLRDFLNKLWSIHIIKTQAAVKKKKGGFLVLNPTQVLESPSSYLKYTNARAPPQVHWSRIECEHPFFFFFLSYPDNANVQPRLKITDTELY